MAAPARRVLLVVALVGAVAVFGWNGWSRTQRSLAALATCDALAVGDPAAALAASAPLTRLTRPDADLVPGYACRCRALLATDPAGGPAACADLLAGALLDEEGALRPDVEPPRALVPLLAEAWGEPRPEAADALAADAVARWPGDAVLLDTSLKAAARAGTEGARLDAATRALAALAADPAAPPDAPQAAALRLRVGEARNRRQEYALARQALEGIPDAARTPEALVQLMVALAGEGDVPAMRALAAGFPAHGASEWTGLAHYAAGLSTQWLADPEEDHVTLLRRVLAHEEEIGDPALVDFLWGRLVTQLVLAGRRDEAVAAYDEGRARHAIAAVNREELTRLAAEDTLGGARGALRFTAPEAGVLRVFPDADQPVDAPWEELTVRAGVAVEVPRAVTVTPVRWVYVVDSAVRASGSAWARPGGVTDVTITPGPPVTPAAPASAARRPGDGRRRVVVAILDCADWRIVTYLRERGELPTIASLLQGGHHAVLLQRPAFTAAAMEALSYPEPPKGRSALAYAHELGLELAGLASIGRNPVGGLAAILPARGGLFERLPAGGKAVANLLFTHADQHAGRNAAIVGPGTRRTDLDFRTARRPLTAAEGARFPRLVEARPDGPSIAEIESVAADFDLLRALAGDDRADAVFLRVAGSDILTHSFYAELGVEGQDDGAPVLFDVYRYLDARLAEARAALDADDWLVVMSDHGIKVAMEHDENAFFVLEGEGVAPGRAAGRPALVGVSRLVADALGVATPWPDTGILDAPPPVAGRP